MPSRAARRHHRRTPCILCTEPIAGYRMELGATWVAHSTCFEHLAGMLHARGGPMFSSLPRRSDEFRTAVRAHITRMSPHLRARLAPRQATTHRQNGRP